MCLQTKTFIFQYNVTKIKSFVYLTESCRDDNHTTVCDLRTRAGGRRSRSTNVSVSQSDRFGSDSHNLKVTTSYLFSPDKDLLQHV